MKIAFVVNHDLGMSKGKIAAQVAHCMMGLAQQNASIERFQEWKKSGGAIVVLKCANAEDMNHKYEECLHDPWIPCHGVFDAGRTQVESGSFTVFGIGPMATKKVDAVVKDCKLL
tara:strand:- start:370 stop:714 length:345 start_codon:yes stop_codon:yes gene_type:complete